MERSAKRFSALNLFWIVPLIIILAFAVFMYLIPGVERLSSDPVEGSESWMAALDDASYISEVTLPGTHDSATANVQLAFFSKCQQASVADQLRAGFRYLDIRLGFDENGAKLMHGFCNCTQGPWPWSAPLYLSSVADDCVAFLKEHPTEFIVFAVKHEHGDQTIDEVSSAMQAIVGENPEMWLLGDSIPTVGQARGKLVLLRRYGEAGGNVPGLPLLWANQDGYSDLTLGSAHEDNGSYTLHVQDRYEFPSPEKYSAFIRSLEDPVGEKDLNINFLSTKGTAKYGHPFKFAKELNAKLASAEGLKGWVVLDFGTPRLAEAVYSRNFQ